MEFKTQQHKMKLVYQAKKKRRGNAAELKLLSKQLAAIDKQKAAFTAKFRAKTVEGLQLDLTEKMATMPDGAKRQEKMTLFNSAQGMVTAMFMDPKNMGKLGGFFDECSGFKSAIKRNEVPAATLSISIIYTL